MQACRHLRHPRLVWLGRAGRSWAASGRRVRTLRCWRRRMSQLMCGMDDSTAVWRAHGAARGGRRGERPPGAVVWQWQSSSVAVQQCGRVAGRRARSLAVVAAVVDVCAVRGVCAHCCEAGGGRGRVQPPTAHAWWAVGSGRWAVGVGCRAADGANDAGGGGGPGRRGDAGGGGC
jgi:hypothetical protein